MGFARLARTLCVIACLALDCHINPPATVRYSGGSGTAENPYRIATAADLILLGETPDDYDKHFILTADVDLDPNLPGRRVFDKAVIAPDMKSSQTPAEVSTESGSGPETRFAQLRWDGTRFAGVFNGNGHAVSNLTISGKSYLGLFGALTGDVRVSNLTLQAVDIEGTGACVGALVGSNGRTWGLGPGGTVTRCSSAGTVKGARVVGGLVGWNEGCIALSSSTGSVVGGPVTGGLAGYSGGTITLSCSDGTVTARGDSGDAGGLVGWNYGAIIASHSACNVSGRGRMWGLGGLVGYSDWAYITMSYSTGDVTGDEALCVGGLVGFHAHGHISTSYSTGQVNGTDEPGGLVGNEEWGWVSASCWDIETSGLTTSAGGTGLTTAQMQDIKTYERLGWDFVGETKDGLNQVWMIPESGGYPVLAVFNGYTPPDLRGQGTEDDPYLISNAAELGAVWYRDLSAHYSVSRPIDLSGIRWSMAVIPWFDGTFEGNGHAISNLHIQGGDLGLFGHLGDRGSVADVRLEAIDVNGAGYHVGGLVAHNQGAVTRCSSNGTIVKGLYYVGGLVGYNDGSITMSRSAASVAGHGEIGGLVGRNCGDIAASYSTGEATAAYRAGGFAGTIVEGEIRECYSTGKAVGAHGSAGFAERSGGRITASFWDITTSGQTESDGGAGKTTGEMQTASTFLEAGWDFIDETENGTEDIWWIDEGNDYPRLWWERGDEPPR